jgi:hypothetical protein
MDGVTFTVSPDLRERKVDEFGTYVVDLIHQGDTVEAKTTFAEKSLAVIQSVYQFGYEVSDTLWGIGRTPGQKGSDKAGPLLLHPLDGNGTADDVTFYKAVVRTNGEVQFGTITADRVFQATFGMLIDPTQNDGQLIGTLGVPHAGNVST